MWIHNAGIGAFDLHGLIYCESEGLILLLLCIHNVGIETSDLHELILYVSEGLILLLHCIHIANIVDFCLPCLTLMAEVETYDD